MTTHAKATSGADEPRHESEFTEFEKLDRWLDRRLSEMQAEFYAAHDRTARHDDPRFYDNAR